MPPKRRRPYGGTPSRRRVRRRLFGPGRQLFGRRGVVASFRSRSGKRKLYRRSRFKRRVNRRRRTRGSRKPGRSFKMRVINALSDPQWFTMEYGQEHTCTAATTTSGTVCEYFSAEETAAGNSGINKSNVVSVPLFHYAHLRSILDNIWNTGTINPSIVGTLYDSSSFRTRILLGGQAVYTLRNQSTETEYVDAYYCRARKDVASDITQVGVYNLYQYLSHGFFNNKIATNSSGTDNAAMYMDQYTPFNSFDFCRYFKIYKVKRLKMEPSETSILKISSKSRMFSPIDWFWLQNETIGWNTVPQSYEYIKATKFVLFKLKARPAGAGVQPNSTKAITFTTPTVIMDTKFKYKCKIVQHPGMVMGQVKNFGIVASAAPAIIVPDGDAVGIESDAF